MPQAPAGYNQTQTVGGVLDRAPIRASQAVLGQQARSDGVRFLRPLQSTSDNVQGHENDLPANARERSYYMFGHPIDHASIQKALAGIGEDCPENYTPGELDATTGVRLQGQGGLTAFNQLGARQNGVPYMTVGGPKTAGCFVPMTSGRVGASQLFPYGKADSISDKNPAAVKSVAANLARQQSRAGAPNGYAMAVGRRR